MSGVSEMRIFICGFGTVGQGFAEVLHDRKEFLSKRFGDDAVIVGAMDSKSYVYDQEELASGEGISLPADSSSHIGFSSKDNERAFHYDPDKRPALLVEEGQDISALENEPAIRRKPKKNEQ